MSSKLAFCRLRERPRPTLRRLVALSCFYLATAACGPTARPAGASALFAAGAPGTVSRAGFVSAADGHLQLNGAPYAFVSTNSYRMLESPGAVEQTFAGMAHQGLNVLRFFAFSNGESGRSDYNSVLYFNTTPGSWPARMEYPEPAWQQLDYVLKRAADYHIHLIMPLANYWDGGIDTYARWTGQAPDQSQLNNREVFYQLERGKELYADYVRHMLNRVNHLTGVAYKDDPTILMWEPINEARGRTDPSGQTVAAWLNWAAGVIKSEDPSHLVGPGSEGFFQNFAPAQPLPGLNYDQHPFHANRHESVNRYNPLSQQTEYDYMVPEGAYFPDDCVLPNIDVCSVHAWPYNWFVHDDAARPVFTGAYIKAHREMLQQLGISKPLYVAEFGRQVARLSREDLSVRDAIYQEAYQEAATAHVDGMGYWNIGFGSSGNMRGYLSFDVLCDVNGSWDSTCNIISNYKAQLAPGLVR